MSATILTITPTSGESQEVHFGEHFRHPLWVEFIDNNYEKWVGCFSSDYPNVFNEVLVDNGNNSAFVVSAGIGHLVDLNKKELIYKTEDYPLIESVLKTNDPEYFLAGTFSGIYILDSRKLVHEVVPNTIIDGVYLKSQSGKTVLGDLASIENQYESNLDFELDLVSFELSMNQKVIRTNYKLFEKIQVVDNEVKKKPTLLKRIIDKLF